MSEIPPYLTREANIPPFTGSKYVLDLRSDEAHLSWTVAGENAGITNRSIIEYEASGALPKDFLRRTDAASLKVVELAPGLAEFLPEFARIAQTKPVAIDVIDYREVTNLLKDSLSIITPEQKREVEGMISRAETITRLVDYICCPVEMLKFDHPELKGRFDMVVYFEGVITNDNTAKGLINWLLKPK